MGALLWLVSGALAFFTARIIPAGRGREWTPELLAALLVAMGLGILATALDFGGWNELDWRAGVLTFLGGIGAVGAIRAIRLAR